MVVQDQPGTVRRVGTNEMLAEALPLDTPMQLLWLLDGDLDAVRVREVADRIADSPLSVRLAGPRVRGARPYWLPHRERPVVEFSKAIETGSELHWADQHVLDTEFDVRSGVGWSLAAAATTSRTVAVSFLISHTVTDGQGMLAGLTTALGPDRPPASLLRSPTRRADLADAIGAGGRAHARVTLATTTQMGHDFNPLAMALNGLRAARRRRQAPVSPTPHTAVLVVDSNELAAVAARYGGTATSLSIALTANTTLALDDGGDQRIRLQMPVSRRAHDSPRGGNEVAATVVDLGPSHGRYIDLARIRSISKQAYAHAAPVVMGAIADCDAALSSVGAIPTVVANAFGTPTAIIPRSLRRRMPSNLPLSARPSIMVFRTFTDSTTTFTFVGSHDRIASVAAAEFTAWGISPVAQWQNTRPETR